MRAANDAFAAALKQDDVDAALNADDAFHAVLLTASANSELTKTLDRLMPRLRRLERLRFGSLAGRASVRQHDAIIAAAGANDVKTTAERVRENWLSLGTLIDRSFE
jgi:DNA-binding GntR family transcriptional regulator